ncbi:CHAT domain-containing protein [Streptomyces antarcticus]|uniref:CHAT domain-containing protein n=1 Tax=Streptomyces antarcticus TaxID=2996458 RepID=UPI002270254B|nr:MULTISPECIES: CHAT domain-containing protein [unclassified Streptomyces]MCY0947081.1 CHAT domain-containing protein [Streptomyces sp. H34-AA3]MCZ4084006.1 CHAT domain-containing protein [Streptomyces sp. H34-S5]
MNPEQAGIPARPWEREIVTTPAGDDLDDTIRALLDLLAQAPEASTKRADAVRDLGNAMLTRYLRPSPHGEQYRMDALDTAADLYSEAWDASPADDATRAGYASNHAVALLKRFRALGREEDLARAEEQARTAVGLTPLGHPDRIGRLHTLATTLAKRAHRLGDAGLLDDAVRQHAEAVVSLTPNHPRRVAVVSGFGNGLHQRYRLSGHLADLTQAVTCHEVALAECGNSHPARAACLSNLGDCLLTRFHVTGKPADLTTANERLEEALVGTAEVDPDFPTRLNNLAYALRTRYDKQGDPSDLDRAVALTEQALSGMPSVHAERPALLGNRGAALHTRYKHRGDPHDLTAAEKALREAVESLPATSLDRPLWLNNLGNVLFFRFERCGTPAVIEEAVACLTLAVEHTTPRHPSRSTRLHNLASAHRARYDRCHRPTDLDLAVEGERAAVAAAAPGTRAEAVALGGLGSALRDRFGVRGVLGDLDTAVDVIRKAVSLVSARDPDRPTWLAQLGGALAERHNLGIRGGDADDAVSALVDAVQATEPGHPQYVRRMLSLAEALRLRHAEPAALKAADGVRERSDLDHAVGCCRAAVRSAGDGHPDRAAALHQLGGTLLTRYRRDHRAVDLWRGLRAQHWALALTPVGHPDRAVVQRGLAYGVRLRHQRTGRLDDARAAVRLAREAAEVRGPENEPASPTSLAELARCLRTLAVALDTSSPGGRQADGYRAEARAQGRLALELHVRDAAAQDPQSALATARGARLHTAEVARWCLSDQRPHEAVEVLELGRGLVVHAAMLSGSVGDRLRKADRPDLAEDWEVARAEAHRSRRRTVPEDLRHQVITALAADGNQPEIPGPPTLEEIRDALRATGNDALVYVVTGTPRTAGYALLVLRTGRPVRRELPGLRAVPGNPLARYVDAYNRHLRASDARVSAEAAETGTALRKAREESHAAWSTWTHTLDRLCDWAWEVLVGQLLKALPTSGRTKPRLVLVPSGHAGLVPWHAARRSDGIGPPRYAVHEAIFSYAASARAFHTVAERELAAYDGRALLVGNPTKDLKHADDEADSLRAYYPLAERLGASDIHGTAPAVPGRVLAALPGPEGGGLPMVHLACHATFDRDPTNSRLLLANGQSLTVSRLLAHGGRRVATAGPLVVLSACTSALTADNFDEALTLSTAFLTAGAAATVGSLWTVDDMRTPALMEEFHRLMTRGGLTPAEALGEAQARQADSAESGSPYYWAAFSHHGR